MDPKVVFDTRESLGDQRCGRKAVCRHGIVINAGILYYRCSGQKYQDFRFRVYQECSMAWPPYIKGPMEEPAETFQLAFIG
ncbi:hypothetical protein FX016_13925 [Cupriavidus gilardii]|nr:hypothetical protein FX016_13925 [Cupriavidus gilardii]